jgi:hypothetical protein
MVLCNKNELCSNTDTLLITSSTELDERDTFRSILYFYSVAPPLQILAGGSLLWSGFDDKHGAMALACEESSVRREDI